VEALDNPYYYTVYTQTLRHFVGSPFAYFSRHDAVNSSIKQPMLRALRVHSRGARASYVCLLPLLWRAGYPSHQPVAVGRAMCTAAPSIVNPDSQSLLAALQRARHNLPPHGTACVLRASWGGAGTTLGRRSQALSCRRPLPQDFG
jgi:hypothetical protein